MLILISEFLISVIAVDTISFMVANFVTYEKLLIK